MITEYMIVIAGAEIQFEEYLFIAESLRSQFNERGVEIPIIVRLPFGDVEIYSVPVSMQKKGEPNDA